MTNLDQFESVFKAAAKPVFAYEPIPLRSLLLVTDQGREAGEQLLARIREFLGALGPLEAEILDGTAYQSVPELLEQVRARGADLLCTYRNLHTPATDYPYSLGVFVDVLTQATDYPVLLVPHPAHLADEPQLLNPPSTTMAITDHLAGDQHLVSYAVRFTPPHEQLLLAHVEDQITFERYMSVIERIASIDTDDARKHIQDRLLKDARDYIQSCREVLRRQNVDVQITELVTMGHQLADYKCAISEHQARLVVLNTKDHDQLAMHGLAYPLTVELRRTPMLLL